MIRLFLLVDVPASSVEGTHPERSTVWNPNWQIRKDSKDPIHSARLECQIMGNLMDSQEQILIRRSSDYVRCEEEGP
jgi:hypothetical protein